MLEKLTPETSSTETASNLVSPYGGELVNLIVPADELQETLEYANRLPALQISERATCDLESYNIKIWDTA